MAEYLWLLSLPHLTSPHISDSVVLSNVACGIEHYKEGKV